MASFRLKKGFGEGVVKLTTIEQFAVHSDSRPWTALWWAVLCVTGNPSEISQRWTHGAEFNGRSRCAISGGAHLKQAPVVFVGGRMRRGKLQDGGRGAGRRALDTVGCTEYEKAMKG